MTTKSALFCGVLALATPLGMVGCSLGSRAAGKSRPHHEPPRLTGSEAIPLAVTIDDLPFVGATAHREPSLQALDRIVMALEQHGVPATGFVVCSKLDGMGPDALSGWSRRHLQIGNHSTTHRSIDDVPLAEWVEDVRSCQRRLTETTGTAPRFFRYPMLRTGSERGTRDAAATHLSQMELVNAPVSIDTSEWLLAAPYARAIADGNDTRAAEIADAYLQHLRLAVRHYRGVARARFGREIRQVLLLHANALLADHIEQLIALLRAEGVRFTSLGEALADPIYGQEDDWVGAVGVSWLYRVKPADLDGWSWDRGQQRALEARFNLRPDEPTRIGRALSVRPLEGAPAWIVTHEKPMPANSLVFIANDGSPILADTPWTPTATRALLDWVELRFGRKPALATISHFHTDAAGGIEALLDAEIPVIASAETSRLLAERGGALQATLVQRYGEDFAGWTVPPPNRTFNPQDGFSARVGESDVQVIFPGAAHTPDNVVTWFPQARVLFGGCILKGGNTIGYLGDADLESYPKAVTALRKLEPQIVIPGHGDRTDAELIENTRRVVLRHRH